MLSLETVVEELLEQSVAVQDAVTGNGQVQGRARIKEARCQTTKTTITQSGIGLFFQNHGQILAQCSQGSRASSTMPRLERLLSNARPMRNSAEK